MGALVVPNFDAFIRLFDEQGLVYDKQALVFMEEGGVRTRVKVGQDSIDRPDLKAIIDEEICKANAELVDYERSKKYHIPTRKLTVESGDMTPTMTVRRAEVTRIFKTEIDGLYD